MKVLREDDGQAILLVAVFMGVIMFGFLALAIDTGRLFQQKRVAQSAADAAAVAAAEEVASGPAAEQSAANAAAQMNGVSSSATVTLAALPSGNYTAGAMPSNWIQARVIVPVQTFFLGAFISGKNKVNVGAVAVASDQQPSPTCICLEGGTGTDLNMSNGSKLNAAGCGVTADSSSSSAVQIVGGSSLSALSLNTFASGWSQSSDISGGSTIGSTKVNQGTAKCTVPMPAVPVDTTCSADPMSQISGGGVSYTAGPNSSYGTTTTLGGVSAVCYNSLTVNGNGDTATLNPGIYIINGGTLHFNSGGPNKGGNGVLFYLTNGASLLIDNGANVNLVAGGGTQSGGGNAPSTGSYNGILFYQDPGQAASNNSPSDAGDSNSISVQGGASSYFYGAIYAPLAPVTLGNGSGTTITADIVAKSLTMNGGGTLISNPNSNMGSFNQSTAKVTQ